MKKHLSYLSLACLSILSTIGFAAQNDPNLQNCQQTWASSSAAFAGVCSLKGAGNFVRYEPYFPTHPCSVQATCATGVGGQPPIQSFLRYKENEPHIINCSGQLFTSENCPASAKKVN